MSVGTLAFGPEAVDWNNDGHPDVVVVAATEDSPVTRIVLEGNGTRAFTAVPQFDFIGPLEGLHAVGALDADGVADDFVVVHSTGTLAIKSGGDVGFTDIEPGPDAIVHHLEIHELDGDGLGDIVALVEDTVGGGTALWVALQTGEALVFTVTMFPVQCGARSFALGDLDKDGMLDIVARGPGGEGLVTIRLGDGEGGFPQARKIEVAPADELRIADVNGDGANEVITTNHANGTLTFALPSP